MSDDDLTRRVIAVIAENQKLPPEKVTIDSTFEELGIDSLDGVNILFALENEFNISIPDEGAQNMRSVRDSVEAMRRLLAGGADTAAQPS
ncbi:MAG TPA: phosphopantetheine-binding protein [Bryobacteraceae bacterium]|mgnify:CR=1 FL=1|jgi:acyl carrier protein|nr:phosphopantetheine-binding protein [Bryobacteraceae bacterium]